MYPSSFSTKWLRSLRALCEVSASRRRKAESFLAVMAATPLVLQIEVLSARDWYERAMRWGCQVADGAYLGLALELGAPIATTNRGLMTAARSNKAKLHWLDTTA
jgi:predicted nucleic acid-binding protein